MKKIFIAFAITSALLLSACNEEEHIAPGTTERVAMVMRGGLTGITSNTRGLIEPQDPKDPQDPNAPRNDIKRGLPPQQLDINIITVNYTPPEGYKPSQISGQPNKEAWRGQTADVTRGFFGENKDWTTANNNNPIIPAGDRANVDRIPDSGRIEYTDEDATGVQKVFYDENGEYYFVRMFYPYDPYDPKDETKKDKFGTEFTISADKGASIIFHNVDGSQDILCSNLGWGNNYNPVITTEITPENTFGSSEDPSDDEEGEIVFSHMMSLFKFKIKPGHKVVTGNKVTVTEDGVSVEKYLPAQYGEIQDVQVVRQPKTLIADAESGKIDGLNDDETNYKANNFTPFHLSWNDDDEVVDEDKPVTVDAGYIIVFPGREKYRIEVQTANHKWVYGDLIFAKDEEPKPGKSYVITITMKQAYEMLIIETEVDHWWMDHVFN